MKKLSIRDVDVKGKRVLTRVDFNVPLDNDRQITDDTRILESMPTIRNVLDRGGRLILMSHLGRPRDREPELSLAPVAHRLAELVANPLRFADDCVGPQVKQMASSLRDGEILLLENLRYHPEEEKNDTAFAKELASLGDIYVNDAFGTAHRAHASTAGVGEHIPVRAAGFLMEKELRALGDALHNPTRPFLAVLGGAKVSTKASLIKSLLERVDVLLIGGGMMYTFIRASGLEVGKSLVDEKMLPVCKELLHYTRPGSRSRLLLPVDSIVAQEIDDGAPTREVSIADIPEDWIGVDIGPKTVDLFKTQIATGRTIFWNGPMGIFEKPSFAEGTRAIARAIADATGRGAQTIVGGGDSVAAVNLMGIANRYTHISTGGGASLEFMEGQPLPGVEALCDVAEVAG